LTSRVAKPSTAQAPVQPSDARLPATMLGQGDGLLVHLRVTPRGGRDAIDGIAELSDGRAVLKLRVRAVAQDGAANRAVEKIIAQSFNVPVSRVAIVAGASARLKQVRIEGDAAALMQTLRAMIA